MLDYPLLKALLAVEREGSFEGAARALGITSSAVSQRIKLLEERVGAIAVSRNPVHPSRIGSILCRHAEQVMLLEEKLIDDNFENFPTGERGPVTIRIAVNDDSLSSWFLDVLKPGPDNDERFLFDISIADQDHSIEQMKSGEVLAAISVNKTPAQGFRSIPLGTHLYRATASPDFVQRHFPDGVTLEALQATPSLRYSCKDDLQKQWMRQAFGESRELPCYMLPSSHGFVSACIMGVAWGMNPALMVDDHIAAGDLVELVEGQALEKPLYWHVSRVVADTLSQVTEKVRKAAREHLIQVPVIFEPNKRKIS